MEKRELELSLVSSSTHQHKISHHNFAIMQTRASLSNQLKAERIKKCKREYMRKKRAESKAHHPHLVGPVSCPHGNSLALRSQSPEEKAARKRTLDRLAQRRRRAKQKLLLPLYRLSEEKELENLTSWFALHAGSYEYVLHLPCWEFYSTKLNSIYKHARQVLDEHGVKGPKHAPKQEQYGVDDNHWVEIQEDVVEFLDKKNDLLHVAREGSPILEDISRRTLIKDPIYNNGILDINFSVIVNGLMAVGKGDKVRSPNSRRISFGFNEYGTPTGFGRVDKGLGKNAMAFKKEVGKIAELLCAAMMGMQVGANNGRLWNNSARDAGYAGKIRTRLYLSCNSPMRAEMVVVCTMQLTPNPPRNKVHKDVKNPIQPGYNRNGTFSAVVTDENGNLHLVQVLVASRPYAVTLGKKGIK